MIPPDDSYEPDSEELAYMHEQNAEFEALCEGHDAAERELRDYHKHTDRQLREANKQAKSIERELQIQYQYDVESDCFEVSEDLENYVTVPRNAVPRTLTRKDKRRIKGDLRRHLRRNFGILTKRGCSPRQVKGYEDRSFTSVVAAK